MSSNKKSTPSAPPQTKPFPKTSDLPIHLNQSTPIGILTQQVLLLIDLLSGKLVFDALPLVGGKDIEKEVISWNEKLSSGHACPELIPFSGYMTASLGAMAIGNSAAKHITCSSADAVKAIYEIACLQAKFKDEFEKAHEIIHTKDLTPMDKLETLISFIDVMYDSLKNTVLENAKLCPDSLKASINDIDRAMFHIGNIARGSEFLNIRLEEVKKEDPSNIE